MRKDYFIEIKKALDGVEGFLSPREAYLLFELASKSKYPIVEIGSWKGKSTICLAKGTQAGYNQKVYAVTPILEVQSMVKSGLFLNSWKI